VYQFVCLKGHLLFVYKGSETYSTVLYSVYSCFINFANAFDRIKYWKLFTKLLDDQVVVNVVKIVLRMLLYILEVNFTVQFVSMKNSNNLLISCGSYCHL